MLVTLLIRLVIVALAFVFTAWVFDGVELSGGVFGALWVSLLFGLINATLGMILMILALPLIFLTLGLLAVLINALMLALTDAITSHLTIDEFWWTTIWASITIAVVTVVLELALSAFRARGADESKPVLT